MFEKSSNHLRHKYQVLVMITLSGQEPFEAVVFVKVNERLIDLLNDERAFIPVKRLDGTTIITAKSNIVSIIEQEPPEENIPEATIEAEAVAEEAKPEEEQAQRQEEEPKRSTYRPRRSFDPYEVLRVSPDASLEEVRRAYKARIKAVHPDTIAALDLDEDLERAANLTAQKVNHAYQRIVRDRQRTGDAETEAGAA